MEDHLKQGKQSTVSYVICMLFGLGLLFPWNSIVTVMDYYLVVFPAYHPSRVLTLIYQASAFFTVAVLAYHEARVDTRFRVLLGFSLYFVSSLMVPIIDLASHGGGGLAPYTGLCALCMLFGLCDGLVQGGLVGDLSYMHPHLLQSFSAGAGASGAATSGLRLVTKACFASTKGGLRKGALVFFFLSTSFQLLCLLLYAVVFPKLETIKNYRKAAALEGATTVGADLAAAGIHVDKDAEECPTTRLSNFQLLTQNLDYAFDAAAIFVLTLSIFPGFLAEDTGKHSLGSWYVVVLIAMYNFGDLTGRYLPLVPALKLKSRTQMLVAVIARYLFLPAFYLTAKFGDQGWMIMLCILLGLSNGHLTTSVLVAAPNGYKKPEQNALGNILVVFILAGVTVGVTLDWLWLIGKGW
ncbi:equilibrative nucleotide transporter 3 isoform X2 [Selaginella moellendorffii]|uniref:equilibrative nucleotide transporter 3 isoform X2 n=1 Tax=Selaginella moellendorffii TaxID=88036 RepID=UPI000D1C8297|nr:equilibrative nucleotide transporter 3 isoform X2 [Selaginella moellendorffii]|eukprot:XP_024521883.1 equilibrative nucleotide transporter 3 isoform X2 [Selaginella moellendorffii]